MDLGLSGRVAVVGGASQGMGLAIAESLRAEGAEVVMFARSPDVLEREAARIGAIGIPADLTDPTTVSALAKAVLERFGRTDILVLNGGGPVQGTATELTADAVRGAVELLLSGHVELVSRFLPSLKASGRGRIVAIESVSVFEPLANLVLSNAVRPAVVGWLKTLARELGPNGVTVNVVAPGLVATPRLTSLHPNGVPDAVSESIGLRRVGMPEEVADVVAFLASERASYVTGSVVKVDGGLSRNLL